MKEQELYKGWNFIENKWEDVTKEVYDTLLDPARCIVALPVKEVHPQEVKGEKEGWIRVEDGLPEKEGSYLAWVTKHNFLGPPQGVFVAYYGFANDEDVTEMFWAYRMQLIDVTHWQPLPKPPQTINEQ